MIVALLILLLGLSAKPVMAADSNFNLVTSPLPLSLSTTPGSTVSAELKIKNGGDQTESIKVGLMKFTAFGDEGKPRLLDREKGDDYFDWVKFSEDSFELEPNEWKTINMTITVPQNAAFGYYYAVTFGRKNDEVASGPKATKIVGQTASLVLLDVRVPQAMRDIEVTQFSTDKKMYEFLPVNFLVKLKNTGNVHVAPRGNIFISQGNNKNVAVLEINENKGNVLPGSNRIFETKWRDGFPHYENTVTPDQKIELDNSGKEVLRLKWDLSAVDKLRWGKYTASMLLVYDDGTRDVPIESKLTFWVMPWRIIIAGGVVLLFTAAGMYLVFGIGLPKLLKRK